MSYANQILFHGGDSINWYLLSGHIEINFVDAFGAIMFVVLVYIMFKRITVNVSFGYALRMFLWKLAYFLQVSGHSSFA